MKESNPARPPRSSSSARRWSERAALGARGGVLDPRAADDEHQPADALGRRQRDVQSDPPPQRVAAQDEALGAGGEHVVDAAGERDRAFGVGRRAVPREVERQRQVAFRIEPCRHAVPGAVGAAEPVQQDDALRHTAIL